ncbi:energy transducer TonB [Pedobacter sp. BMA]|uniref:energy transducer TonB n=1 Tax=Pedobacter sp. BMA TaxID=1663685 RepID=UPI00064B2AD8|nr:energy transducer TonB [Pedobacter sp. BMA]KLT67245.1 hypothetical protein AB669_00525 [Pedobacter sp. BMA]
MFNSSFNLYKTEWLDLVFANRNKNYGAYELRSKSSAITTRALFIASALFLLLFCSPLIYSKLVPKEIIVEDKAKLVTLDNVIHQMKPKTEPEKKAEPAKAEPVKVKTVALSQNIVVVNKVDLPDPPTVKEIENAVISDKTQEGIISPAAVVTTSTGTGDGNGTAKDGERTGSNEPVGLEGVDEYPEFAGGAKAWSKYMERNLRYPSRAQEENIQGKVFVSFVVERDGSITDVSVIRGIGFGCDEEAMKVIKKSPLWKPGRNKGTAVRVRYNMAINFQMM